MNILFSDNDIIVCLKPERVLSTDEPGGVPELIRRELNDESADVRTVHRLDRVVGGVMVLARNAAAASELSRQIRAGKFQKEYLAVISGELSGSGTMRDLLWRDKARKMTFVAEKSGKGVQEAVLDYEALWHRDGVTGVRIVLHTGRTHQIRCQFASRGLPLVGERKYCEPQYDCGIALWSHSVGFTHPKTGEYMRFEHEPPHVFPWCEQEKQVIFNSL